jgi:hypothetical protein
MAFFSTGPPRVLRRGSVWLLVAPLRALSRLPVAAVFMVGMGLIGALGSGCAHTVVINTDPPGAKVFVDGRLVGESPVVTQQQTGLGGHLTVRVESDGFVTEEMQVPRSDWFLWPGIIALVPLFGLPALVAIPIGPIITVAWALLTSPSLLALAFVRKYPDQVVIKLTPRSAQGFLQPTDVWLIPDDESPNPVPVVPKNPTNEPPSAEAEPKATPGPAPPQPDGGNPVP